MLLFGFADGGKKREWLPELISHDAFPLVPGKCTPGFPGIGDSVKRDGGGASLLWQVSLGNLGSEDDICSP